MTGEADQKRPGPAARMRARFEALPGNVRGALWLLLSAVLYGVMAVLAKYLGARLDSFQTAFFRALFGLIVILPFLLKAGWAEGGIRTGNLPIQILRGFVGSAAMVCGFYAFTHMPLADAQALNFTRTLFLVPLAAVLLRETLGARRVAAALAGFGGVLIMLRPTGAIEPAALVALLGAVLVALAVVLVKIASRTDKPVTLMFYTGIVGIFVTGVPAYFAWQPPTLEEYLLLALMGAAGAASHNFFIRGYSAGEATVIAPFEYSTLVFVAVGGFLVFGDLPTVWTLSGAAVIIGAALYIVRREAQAAREKAAVRPLTD